MSEPPIIVPEETRNSQLDGLDFAPAEPTDGRIAGDWKHRYESDALKQIRSEAIYLGILFALVPISMLLIWVKIPDLKAINIDDTKYLIFEKYSFAWLGGILGGVIFDIKWLYHCVAKNRWHMGRRLWRIFVPWISGGFAFIFITLISSGLLIIFDQNAMKSPSLVFGFSFLIGYFSDTAIGKLADIAETLLGSRKGKSG